MSTTFEWDGLIWRYYSMSRIPFMPSFWWADLPDGGLMAFCPGEILLRR